MNRADLNIPEDSDDFFRRLKEESEKFWEKAELKKEIFGFQIQKGTKWIRGLSASEIKDYENELRFEFPEIYKNFLKNMNGTDKPAINIYGNSGKVAYAPEYYSFPRDIEVIKDNIQWIYKEFKVDDSNSQFGNNIAE